MPIDLDQPVVTPAVPEKFYDELWILRTVIETPVIPSLENGFAGSALMEMIPFSRDRQELAPEGQTVSYASGKLWVAINEVPEVAAVFEALVAAANPFRAWVRSQE